MRNLIEYERKDLIVCDNTACDFAIPNSEEAEKGVVHFINMPCPLCGENLLTEEDYLQDEKIMRSIRWINKWFSWITIFFWRKRANEGKIVTMHVHDGITIKTVTDVRSKN